MVSESLQWKGGDVPRIPKARGSAYTLSASRFSANNSMHVLDEGLSRRCSLQWAPISMQVCLVEAHRLLFWLRVYCKDMLNLL
eukprot:1436031-Pyramimonas_sp.AAC.1